MTTAVSVHTGKTFRTEVEARTHRYVLDEPQSAGGNDEGPTPYEALASALASCTAMTLRFYANREHLPLDAIDVTVEHDRQHAKDCADCVTHSGYIHRFTVSIRMTGDLTIEQKTHLLSIAARCPVAKTLASEIKIDEKLIDGASTIASDQTTPVPPS